MEGCVGGVGPFPKAKRLKVEKSSGDVWPFSDKGMKQNHTKSNI